MHRSLSEVLKEKGIYTREVWLDVDGVMTRQEPVVIYELLNGNGEPIAYERHQGLTRTGLVPLDANGNPTLNRVEFFAARRGSVIAEGYGFDTRDGKVVEYLVQAGYLVRFISGRNSPVVENRALALRATPLLGIKDKLPVIREHARCSLGAILFCGDGIQDVETLHAVREAGGIAIAPADACSEALVAAECVTIARGGEGVLHEIFSTFLRHRRLWPDGSR